MKWVILGTAVVAALPMFAVLIIALSRIGEIGNLPGWERRGLVWRFPKRDAPVKWSDGDDWPADIPHLPPRPDGEDAGTASSDPRLEGEDTE
jgi:hypothetical protein